MNYTTKAVFFKHNSEVRYQRASHVLDQELGQLFTPYYSFDFHAKSVIHPFINVVHVIADSVNIGYGMFLFTASMYSSDVDGISEVSVGLGLQLTTVVLDTINCPVSVLSLITRSLSSNGPSGYISRISEKSPSRMRLHHMADDGIHKSTCAF